MGQRESIYLIYLLDVRQLEVSILVIVRSKRIARTSGFWRRCIGRHGQGIILWFLVLVLRLDQHLHQVLHHFWIGEQISFSLVVGGVLQLLEHRAVVRKVWVDKRIIPRDVFRLKA